MPRVRIPEVKVGPPLTRWKRERVVVVDADEAEALVRDHGAEILDAPKTKSTKGKKGDKE